MAFDDIPEDREQSFPCPNEGCDGDITQDKKQGGLWQCNKCDWVPPAKYADYDDYIPI
jgi:ribosomal protein L37AE/L43A